MNGYCVVSPLQGNFPQVLISHQERALANKFINKPSKDLLCLSHTKQRVKFENSDSDSIVSGMSNRGTPKRKCAKESYAEAFTSPELFSSGDKRRTSKRDKRKKPLKDENYLTDKDIEALLINSDSGSDSDSSVEDSTDFWTVDKANKIKNTPSSKKNSVCPKTPVSDKKVRRSLYATDSSYRSPLRFIYFY